MDADYLAENDDIAAHGLDLNSPIEMTHPPGEYTIKATYEQNATGDFALTVKGVGSTRRSHCSRRSGLTPAIATNPILRHSSICR